MKKNYFRILSIFRNTGLWIPCSAFNTSPANPTSTDAVTQSRLAPAVVTLETWNRSHSTQNWMVEYSTPFPGHVSWQKSRSEYLKLVSDTSEVTSKVSDSHFKYSLRRFYWLSWSENGAKRLAIHFRVSWDQFQISRVTTAGARQLFWSRLQ